MATNLISILSTGIGADKSVISRVSSDGNVWTEGQSLISTFYPFALIVSFQAQFWSFVSAGRGPSVLRTSDDGLKWSEATDLGFQVRSATVFNEQLLVLSIDDPDHPTMSLRVLDAMDSWQTIGGWGVPHMIKLATAFAADQKSRDTLWLFELREGDGAVSSWTSQDGKHWSDATSYPVPRDGFYRPTIQDFCPVFYKGDMWISWRSKTGVDYQSPSVDHVGKIQGNGIISVPLPSFNGMVPSACPALAVLNDTLYAFAPLTSDTNTRQTTYVHALKGGQWSVVGQIAGNIIAAASRTLINGTIRPKYQVLSIIYSPPGNRANSPSQVSYSGAQSLSTSVTNTTSFSDSRTVGFEAGSDLNTVGSNFSFETSRSHSNTVTMSATTQNKIKVLGPNRDTIDHNQDCFYLWTNPIIHVAVDERGYVKQTLSIDGTRAMIQYVYAGQLNGSLSIPDGVKNFLHDAGLDSDDYQEILNLNPFVATRDFDPSGDTRRYVNVKSFPYDPPPESGEIPITTSYTFESDNSTEKSDTVSTSYTVEITVSAGLANEKLDWAMKLSSSEKMTYTNSNTTMKIASSTSTAEADVTGPSYGYSGPVQIDVYLDRIYNTFAFVFAPRH